MSIRTTYTRVRASGGARGVLAGALALLLCLRPAVAQGPSRLLIVSQPEAKSEQRNFVDLANHLAPRIREDGRFEPLIFSSSLAEVSKAINTGGLTAADIVTPLSHEKAHKVAGAVGATLVLFVSAQNTKDGVTAQAELQTLLAQGVWHTASVNRYTPPVRNGKKPGLLEGVLAHTAGILKQLNVPTAPMPMGPGKTIEPAKQPDTGAAKPSEPGPAVVQPPTGQQPSQPTVAPAKPAETISQYQILADRARRTGDTANLILALRRAVTEKPFDVRLRRDLIQAYRDRGMIDAARDEAARAIALAPEDGTLRRYLGDGLLQAGHVEAAIKEYEVAVRLDGKDPLNHVALGDARMKNGQPDDAEKCYAAALAATDRSALVHRRIAVLGVQRGRYKESAAALTAAIALDPDDRFGFIQDYGVVLGVVDTLLLDVSARLQVARVGFRNGTLTREQAYGEFNAQKKRVEDLSAFLDEAPDGPAGRVKALYAQAAGLLLQACEKLVEFLETQNTAADDDAGLLRLEGNKQLGEAGKRLKAMTDEKPEPPAE